MIHDPDVPMFPSNFPKSLFSSSLLNLPAKSHLDQSCPQTLRQQSGRCRCSPMTLVILLWSTFQFESLITGHRIELSVSATSVSSFSLDSSDPSDHHSSSSSSSSSSHSFSYHSSQSGSPSSSSSRHQQQWPLRYHDSPWLHKEFIIRTDPADRPPMRQETDSSDCDDATHESGYSGYGYGAYYTCQASDECDQFVPSAHCNRKMKESRERLAEQDPLSYSDIMNDRDDFEESLNQQQEPTPKPTGRETYRNCHYLTESLISEMCSHDMRPIRKELISKLHLRSCRRFSLKRSLDQHLYTLVINSTDCARILRELLLLDNLVEELACEYESILNRYDCAANWSVKWSCQDCRLAYRDWLCSVIIPYHTEGILIKPCQTVCEQVEQKCPHLHPYGKGQYAGEPVFLCIDPNIPFNQQITPNIPFGEKGSCYNSCDLESCYSDDGESPVLDCYQPEEVKTTTTTAPEVDLVTTDSTATGTSTESILNPDITLMNDSIYETTTNDYSKELIDQEDGGTILVSLLDEDHVDQSPGLNNNNKPSTVSSVTKTGDSATTTTLSDIDQLNENFYDESGPTSGPITDGPPWNGDEDYYVIQSMPDQNNKQSQSIQFIELEPNYNVIAETNQKSEIPVNNNQQETISVTSRNYVQGLDEIFKEALASTTATPILNHQNNQPTTKEKEILISLELSPDQTAIIQDDSWTGNREHQQNSVGNPASSGAAITTTSPTSTSTISPYEYGIDITQPTGTEDTPPIVQNNDNKRLTATIDDDDSLYSLKTAVELENLGNRFRHYNSRSKEFILHEKKSSSSKSKQNLPNSYDSLMNDDEDEDINAESPLSSEKLVQHRTIRQHRPLLDTISNFSYQLSSPFCLSSPAVLLLLFLLSSLWTIRAGHRLIL